MKLSTAAETILNYCWVDNEPRSTSFIIGNTYLVNGNEIKPTENTYEELDRFKNESPIPYRIILHGKLVNIMGGRLSK